MTMKIVVLAPNVAEFFKTAEDLNEAPRRLMRETQDAVCSASEA
jgi:hypothetical protein